MAGEPDPKPSVRARPRAKSPEAETKALHMDLRAAAAAMNAIAATLQPLADHMPTIIEMIHAWNTGKAGLGVMGRTGRFAAMIAKATGSFIKWIGSVALGVAAIWAATHSRWSDLMGGHQ